MGTFIVALDLVFLRGFSTEGRVFARTVLSTNEGRVLASTVISTNEGRVFSRTVMFYSFRKSLGTVG